MGGGGCRGIPPTTCRWRRRPPSLGLLPGLGTRSRVRSGGRGNSRTWPRRAHTPCPCLTGTPQRGTCVGQCDAPVRTGRNKHLIAPPAATATLSVRSLLLEGLDAIAAAHEPHPRRRCGGMRRSRGTRRNGEREALGAMGYALVKNEVLRGTSRTQN